MDWEWRWASSVECIVEDEETACKEDVRLGQEDDLQSENDTSNEDDDSEECECI